jgi:hypothetical protein
MWAELGISRLLFIIVPTDTDAFVPPLHELENPALVKVGVLGMDECPCGCFNVLIRETAPFQFPLQSREEVEVAGLQVGAVGAPNRRWQCGWLLLLSCGFSHHPTHSYARLATVGISAAPFASTWYQDHTTLAGHTLFRCPVFNTVLRLALPAQWRSYVPQQTRKAACGHRTQWHPTSSTQFPEIKRGNLFSDYPMYMYKTHINEVFEKLRKP